VTASGDGSGMPSVVALVAGTRPEAIKLAPVAKALSARTESLDAGVGTDEEAIVSSTSWLLTDQLAYAAMARVVYPYGDGTAGARVAHACSWILGHGGRPIDFLSPSNSSRRVSA